MTVQQRSTYYNGHYWHVTTATGWAGNIIRRTIPSRYDADGYDLAGYNPYGYDRDGFDRDGYDDRGFGRDGFDRDGYTARGFGRDGYHRNGYDRDGYDRNGYDYRGFGRDGIHRDTHTERGPDGYDVYGYDEDGYDRDGWDEDGYNADGYDSDGFDRNDENRYGQNRADQCPNCSDWDCNCCPECDSYDRDDCECNRPQRNLHNYSYKPAWKMFYRPAEKEMESKPPTFGMEIEITDRYADGETVAQDALDGAFHCGILKEDGSVDGFEAVTHPMSYEWAMRNFPWDMFSDLAVTSGVDAIPEENGIHIHVGRDAFDSASHLFRWMKFFYRNREHVERIARRSSSHWAPFDRSHRRSQLAHALKHGKSADEQWCIERRLERSNRRDDTLDSRYAAINTTNKDTLEVRVFASTLNASEAKQALQLIASSIEYTRKLASHDVITDAGWSWEKFALWLTHQTYSDGTELVYPELATSERALLIETQQRKLRSEWLTELHNGSDTTFSDFVVERTGALPV